MLDDIGALQWKLAPPLEGEEEKDEVEINEMFAEIESYAQRIEDLAIEVNNWKNLLRLFVLVLSALEWFQAKQRGRE